MTLELSKTGLRRFFIISTVVLIVGVAMIFCGIVLISKRQVLDSAMLHDYATLAEQRWKSLASRNPEIEVPSLARSWDGIIARPSPSPTASFNERK